MTLKSYHIAFMGAGVGLVWAIMLAHAWNKPQPGACVVHAAEECAKHEHCKILFIRYNEIEMGHAMCIYIENGSAFAWDWRGPVELDIPDMATDAKSVAIWLTVIAPPLPNLTVRSAAFEFEK